MWKKKAEIMFKSHCFLSIPDLEGISHPLWCAKHFFACLSLIPPLTVWKCHGSGNWAWPSVASQTILAFLIKLFLFLPSNALFLLSHGSWPGSGPLPRFLLSFVLQSPLAALMFPSPPWSTSWDAFAASQWEFDSVLLSPLPAHF